MNFLKRWLRWQLRVFGSVAVFIILTVGFGALAGTYWPEYAWCTTALFAAIVFGLTCWLG